jgi:hypothetical protein
MQAIIDEILAKSTSYVAPVVPISQMEKTSAGDRMYIAMFQPTMKRIPQIVQVREERLQNCCHLTISA